MRLERMTPAHVRRAIAIYLELAWPADQPGEPPVSVQDLEGASRLEDLFARFERPREHETPTCARFMLRLGNYRYPFMKFVVQEYLVEEEYFFSVDTHDDLNITPEMPDFAGWQDVRGYNLKLKNEIERAWGRAGLPTNEDLRQLMEGIAALEPQCRGRARLLVVDDEEDVARGLQAVLTARGYQVELAFDGRQVLERMAREPLPDLLLLDYSMPEFTGQEVIQRVHENPRSRDIPILLATATSIDLASLQRACGLLRKPYPREVLFAMIEQLLAERSGGSSVVQTGE